ncbi:MAG: AI-2E family transporter [Candidatus Paceibacterota bacterium]|jgi:predicted PurR-regulated permease PerM
MEAKEFNLNISLAVILKISIAVMIFALIYFLRDIFLALLTAVVIASAVDPAATWLSRFRLPRVIGVLVVYVLSFLLLFFVFYFFVPPIFQDVTSLTHTLPKQINTFISENSAWNSIVSFSDGLTTEFSIQEVISHGLLDSPIPGNIYDLFKALFNGIVSFVLVIVISFYLAVQKNGVENFLRVITPVKQEEYMINLWQRTEVKIGRWIQGQLLLGLIVGPMVYIGLMLFGIRYALLLAIVAGLLELIPVFGPVLSAVPAVVLGFSDNFTLGLMVIGFYIIVQQFENHLLYPLVMKKVIGLNPIIVIISLIVGYELAGFLGMILAVPATTLLMEYVNDIEKRKKHVGNAS